MALTTESYVRIASTDPGTGTSEPGAVPSTLNVLAPHFVLPITLTAGGGGSADDVSVVVYQKVLVQQAAVHCTTAVGGSTVTVRTAAAGAGSAASSAISTASTGYIASNLTTAAQTFASGATIYVRRSDNGVGGTVYLSCIPIQ